MELKEQEQEGKSQRDDSLINKFLSTRQILISGEINKELAEKVVTNLLVLEADSVKEPVYIFIDSPGGDADAGFAVFDMIRFIKPTVKTIGMGLVASAASIILLAAKKENRFALPNSHYLIHQPLSGIKGVATDIEIHAKELGKMRRKINRMIAEETGKKVSRIASDTDRDYWMSAEDALEYGLVSKVIETRNELK